MEWQPIETAPKNGTKLLLFYPDTGDRHIPHGMIEGYWFESPKKIDDGWDTMVGSIGDPTHWMPLPLEPQK